MIDLLERRRVLVQRRIEVEKSFNQEQERVSLAQKELRKMEEQVYPRALSDAVLGKITKAELARVKKRRRELKEVVEDWAYLQKGLVGKDGPSELGRLDGEGMKLSWLEQQVRAYEGLRTEILEKGLTEGRRNTLQEYGREIAREVPEILEDMEEFLKEQGKPKS